MDNYEIEKLKLRQSIVRWITVIIILIVLIALSLIIGCPRYNVYTKRMDGEAMLAHAQSSKEVAVCEAKAKLESATMLAKADTVRAIGIAKSNQIIGKSLTSEYLHWFWIDGLEKNPNAVIYIPTEANIPIMEAKRLK